MKPYLLDTNIFGEIIIDENIEEIKQGIRKSAALLFSCRIVRNELRATSKKIVIAGNRLRNDLLSLYDELIGTRTIMLADEDIETAKNYYAVFRELGGNKGKQEMWNDFLIVACASRKNIDIVVSNDEASMKLSYALKAYTLVNQIVKLRTPHFINYKEFKSLLR